MYMKGKLYIGTSGWMYKDWGATFYPQDMKSGFLTYLSSTFNTVEVNSSFYHLPRGSTFAKWEREVPDDFRFAVKLSRFITHQKKLQDPGEPLKNFFDAANGMRTKLAVLLVQLPPRLQYDHTAAEAFLKELRKKKRTLRVALEPRHQSWIDAAQEVRGLLRRYRVALVFPHSAKIPSFAPDDENICADFVYVRFHGPSEFAASRYGTKRLSPWAQRVALWQTKGLDVFVYFNNDVHGHAVKDALTLKRLLAEG